MALPNPFADFYTPDPIPRLQRQIADQRHRQLVAIACHDRAVQADSERRIDGLLDTLAALLTKRAGHTA
jgi:hypothetical protein